MGGALVYMTRTEDETLGEGTKKEDMKLMKPEGLLWWEITPPRLKRNERPGRPVGGVHFSALVCITPYLI